MFAFTGLSPNAIEELRSRYSIYMPSDGRISIASINHSNIDYIVEAIHGVAYNQSVSSHFVGEEGQ